MNTTHFNSFTRTRGVWTVLLLASGAWLVTSVWAYRVAAPGGSESDLAELNVAAADDNSKRVDPLELPLSADEQSGAIAAEATSELGRNLSEDILVAELPAAQLPAAGGLSPAQLSSLERPAAEQEENAPRVDPTVNQVDTPEFRVFQEQEKAAEQLIAHINATDVSQIALQRQDQLLQEELSKLAALEAQEQTIAEQAAAEQAAAEQAAAEQAAAEQAAAEQAAAEQAAAEQAAAEQAVVESDAAEQAAKEAERVARVASSRQSGSDPESNTEEILLARSGRNDEGLIAEEAARAAADALAADSRRTPVAERSLTAEQRLQQDELSVLSGLSARLRFESRSEVVDLELEKTLDRVFDPLFLYAEEPVLVSVSSNDFRGLADNNRLSNERGASIVNYLVSLGLEPDRFRVEVMLDEELQYGNHRITLSVEEPVQ